MDLQENRDFFGRRFSEYLKVWKDKQKALGERYDDDYFGSLLTPKRGRVSISHYKKGEDLPQNDEALDSLCQVLGVSRSDFTPVTHEEKYENVPEYITEIGRSHSKFMEEVDLDTNFVKSLRHISDFDNSFPLYRPISNTANAILIGDERYHRNVNFSNSAKIDKDLDYLQIHRDEKQITLHRCDLAYLKEIQDKVSDYVNFLFYQRELEMKREVEKANDLATLTEYNEETNETKISHRVISFDELCQIDRFAKHCYWTKEEDDNGKH